MQSMAHIVSDHDIIRAMAVILLSSVQGVLVDRPRKASGLTRALGVPTSWGYLSDTGLGQSRARPCTYVLMSDPIDIGYITFPRSSYAGDTIEALVEIVVIVSSG